MASEEKSVEKTAPETGNGTGAEPEMEAVVNEGKPEREMGQPSRTVVLHTAYLRLARFNGERGWWQWWVSLRGEGRKEGRWACGIRWPRRAR